MDTLIINSKFMKGLLSKLVKHYLKKSLNIDSDIRLYDFNAKVDDNVTVKVNCEIKMRKEDFFKMVTKEL